MVRPATRSKLMPGIPQLMKAVLLKGHGGFEQLEYRDDMPVPVPQPGEVLIRVGAAGINNTDINTRTGWYSKAVTEGKHARRRRLRSRGRAWRGFRLDRRAAGVPAHPGRRRMRLRGRGRRRGRPGANR
jgi:hypothetical protein